MLQKNTQASLQRPRALSVSENTPQMCTDTTVLGTSTRTQLEFLSCGEQALPKMCFTAPTTPLPVQDLLHLLIQSHGSDKGVSAWRDQQPFPVTFLPSSPHTVLLEAAFQSSPA